MRARPGAERGTTELRGAPPTTLRDVQARSIILWALSGVASVLLVGLAVAARGGAEVEIDDQALAEARAAHQRRQARVPAAPAAPRSDWRPPRSSSRRQPPPRRVAPAAATAPDEPRLSAREVAESLDDRMDGANALYDRGDYIGAKEAALVILEEHPENIRMLRIAVSVACMMGEVDEAQGYYDRLPARDQRQMARRCKKYGVEF